MFVLHAEVDAHTQEVMSIPPPPFLLIVIDCNYLLTFTFTFTLVLGCVALSCVLSFSCCFSLPFHGDSRSPGSGVR